MKMVVDENCRVIGNVSQLNLKLLRIQISGFYKK